MKESIEYDKLSGGTADNFSSSSFNQFELHLGKLIESEHTDDQQLAIEIAQDHLAEDPSYYSKIVQSGLVDEPKAIAFYKDNKNEF